MSNKHKQRNNDSTPQPKEDMNTSTEISNAAETPSIPSSALDALFEKIAARQFSVNNSMAGADWATEAQQKTRINYPLAILDEAVELMHCAIPFKFWDRRAHTEDLPNARMEIVDILHFAVAEHLSSVFSGIEEDAVSTVAMAMTDAAESIALNPAQEGDSPVEYFSTFVGQILANHKVNWRAFFNLALCFGMSPEKLYALYMAKATLNEFRTEKRALPGGYNKIWIEDTGKEDNFYLMNWVQSLAHTPSREEILNWLNTQYAGLRSTL